MFPAVACSPLLSPSQASTPIEGLVRVTIPNAGLSATNKAGQKTRRVIAGTAPKPLALDALFEIIERADKALLEGD